MKRYALFAAVSLIVYLSSPTMTFAVMRAPTLQPENALQPLPTTVRANISGNVNATVNSNDFVPIEDVLLEPGTTDETPEGVGDPELAGALTNPLPLQNNQMPTASGAMIVAALSIALLLIAVFIRSHKFHPSPL
jgi:hypothetical protein